MPRISQAKKTERNPNPSGPLILWRYRDYIRFALPGTLRREYMQFTYILTFCPYQFYCELQGATFLKPTGFLGFCPMWNNGSLEADRSSVFLHLYLCFLGHLPNSPFSYSPRYSWAASNLIFAHTESPRSWALVIPVNLPSLVCVCVCVYVCVCSQLLSYVWLFATL